MAVVLVVDDDPSVLNAMSRILRRDHTVVTADGVDSAEAVLREKPIDFIVSDLMMVGATGLDLYLWVKGNLPALSDRFIICSGGGPQNLLDSVKENGIQFFTKPVDVNDLLEAIQRSVTPSEP